MPERGAEVVGLREFRRELKQAGQQFPKELRQANKEAAEIVTGDARRRAPRGPHLGGGRVRPIVASIRALASQGRGQIAVGGVSTPHGPVLEFGGTIPRRGDTGARTQVRAQPFLYPALAAKRDEVVEFYGNAVDRLMRRAFPRGAL
jgi:HK97 gp10 family phage protein